MDKNLPLKNFSNIESKNLAIKILPPKQMQIIFAKKNCTAELAKKLVNTNDTYFFKTAPATWFAASQNKNSKVAGLENLAYISEQSASRVCIEVSGTSAREFMQRICQLDLHESIIKKDFFAQTIMLQTNVLLHYVDESPTFHLYIYSGFAESFISIVDIIAKQFIVNE